MAVTGLFYLPNQGSEAISLQDLLNRLTTYYKTSPLPPWSLSHRLFRETPTAPPFDLDKSKPSGQRYLQILSLSHHAPRTHVAITSTPAPPQTGPGTPASSSISDAKSVNGEPATLISIPYGPQSEEFVQLVTYKFASSWQIRQVLYVSHGHAFEVGDFRVRVGKLKQGNAQIPRGIVVEVQWNGGEDEGREDWEGAEAIIGSLMDGLALKAVRKVFWVPGLGDGEGSVRQWIDVLRLRN